MSEERGTNRGQMHGKMKIDNHSMCASVCVCAGACTCACVCVHVCVCVQTHHNSPSPRPSLSYFRSDTDEVALPTSQMADSGGHDVFCRRDKVHV